MVRLSPTFSHSVNQVANDDAVPLQRAGRIPAQESRVRAGGHSDKIQWRTTWHWEEESCGWNAVVIVAESIEQQMLCMAY